MIGYKLFNQDLTNQYGNKLEIQKEYFISDEISFGVKGKGFYLIDIEQK